ncbi:MAG: aminotransferase class I/II-fold pyridoxal phosphate-dependent enzyme [Firmicutes bacterium]|nr:aminotransferase class I/II-fold pyridoxal phosphate-dependent enzyme [Bacillota bacterium]
MIRFSSDYTEGAHPQILKALIDTNMAQTGGYGEDPYCDEAKALILKALGAEPSQHPVVHFLVGGTQTNLTVIAACLRPHQGVLCAPTGHINVHETGAVEACGHKVLPLPGIQESSLPYRQYGKITAAQVEEAVLSHQANGAFEHIVQPGMVYISHPTEYGTLYTKEEMTALSAVCRKYGLPLFVDGARLSYGLAAHKHDPAYDLTLRDLVELTDVFYIGGTKVGLLFGEAVVIMNPAIARDFRYLMKQKGGMLAKGRLLGVQFGSAFLPAEDDPGLTLYESMGRHAVRLAQKMKEGFRSAGFPLFIDSPTNQQFIILPDELLPKLAEDFAFEPFDRFDETHQIIRFCSSWATPEENVDTLIQALHTLSGK